MAAPARRFVRLVVLTGTVCVVPFAAASAQTGWSGIIAELSSTTERSADWRLSVAADGHAIAVWTTRTGLVRTARLDPATRRWSAPTVIATHTADGYELSITADSAGNRLASWRVNTAGGGSEVYYARYTAITDTWTAARVLPNANDSLYAEFALDAAGNVTAVWHQNVGANWVVRSSRISARATLWSAPRDLGSAGANAHGAADSVVVDGDGNVSVAWAFETSTTTAYAIYAAHYTASSDSWAPPSTIGGGPSFGDDPRLVVDAAGNVTAVWTDGQGLGATTTLRLARFNRSANAWAGGTLVPNTSNAHSEHAALAPNGDVWATWVRPVGGLDAIYAARYRVATGTWSAATTLSAPGDTSAGEVAVDAAGNVIATWNRFNGTEEVAQAARYVSATDTWTSARDLALIGGDGDDIGVGFDAIGNAVVMWERDHGTDEQLQSTDWLARSAAPVISAVTPGDQALTVAFTVPPFTEAAFAPINYQYSIDDGASWITRSSVSTGSPLTIGALVNGTNYTIRIRAVNVAGDGSASAPATGTPIGSNVLLPPINLTATVNGNTVTLTWAMPPGGMTPQSFVVAGGVTPGHVAAEVPTSSPAHTFTFAAPTGAFYVRVHAAVGATRSGPSNEILVFVNVPALPNPPENLVGTAIGSTLQLQWRTNRDAGVVDAILLSVSGALSASVGLPGNSSTVSYVGVPPGTYDFTVRASNVTGTSGPSNTVTLTFPGACSAPGSASALTSNVANRIVTLNWTAPTSGTAPTSYIIEAGTAAGMANLATVDTGSTATTFSTPAPPGTYFVRVRAANACGTSAPSAETTVVVR